MQHKQENIISVHRLHREAFHVAIPCVDAWIWGAMEVKIRGILEETSAAHIQHNRLMVKQCYKAVQSAITTTNICTQPTVSKAAVDQFKQDGKLPSASHINERTHRTTRRHALIASVNGDEKGSKGQHAIKYLRKHFARLHHALYIQQPFTAANLDLDLSVPPWVPPERSTIASTQQSVV